MRCRECTREDYASRRRIMKMRIRSGRSSCREKELKEQRGKETLMTRKIVWLKQTETEYR